MNTRSSPYRAELCCVAIQLILEVDGEQHFPEQGRQGEIEEKINTFRDHGFELLRIPGYEVLRDAPAVRQRIEDAI